MNVKDINLLCNNQDWCPIGNALNAILGFNSIEEDGGMFNWDYYILINNSITKQLLEKYNIEALFQGNCWYVLNANDICNELMNTIEKLGYHVLDFISKEEFEK